MTPVHQTQFKPEAGPDAGNCMQAAVASLLDLPLDEVPNFAAHPGDDWWIRFIDWLEARGFWLAMMGVRAHDRALGLVSGTSPRGDWKHLVIMRGDELVHDPHPEGTGVLEPMEFWYLVPMEPT